MITDNYPKTLALRGGGLVTIRLLTASDENQLLAFFRALPEEDRVFMRDDVCDPATVHRWTSQIDLDNVLPLVAHDDQRLVASGSLHLMPHACMRHVGEIRLIVARSHRGRGLGGLMTRELVALAEERGLEKLQGQVVKDNLSAVRMLEAFGFKTVAVLSGMIKDRHGWTRDLAILVADVPSLTQTMEDWIQETMPSAYRVPGDGA